MARDELRFIAAVAEDLPCNQAIRPEFGAIRRRGFSRPASPRCGPDLDRALSLPSLRREILNPSPRRDPFIVSQMAWIRPPLPGLDLPRSEGRAAFGTVKVCFDELRGSWHLLEHDARNWRREENLGRMRERTELRRTIQTGTSSTACQ